MGFLDTVQVPGATKAAATPGGSSAPKGAGSFLSSIQLPTGETVAPVVDAAPQEAPSASGIGGLFSKAYGAAKDYITGAGKQAVDFEKNLVTHPIDTVNNVKNGFADSIIEAATTSFHDAKDAYDANTQLKKEGKLYTAEGMANSAKLISSMAGILFSPVSGTFSGAQKVPILKEAADLINIPFTLTGLAASYGTGKIFDFIPDNILSKESKDTLRGPIQNLASLAAQVVLGGKVMEKVSATIKAKGSISPKDAENISKQVVMENPGVVSEEANKPPETPHTTKTHEEYARSQGYEPYQHPDTLPTIEMGPKVDKAAETLPVIDVGDGTSPESAKITTPVVESANPTEKTPAARTKPGESFVKPKAIQGEDKQVSGLAKKINIEAIQQGLEDHLGSLPEYSRMSMKEQAHLATDLIQKDPQQALRVATLKENSPHPALLPESVSTTFRKMLDNGDITGELAAEVSHTLGTSKSLATYAARLGQGIKAFDTGLDTYEDPVRIVSDIQKARETNVEKTKGKTAAAKETKKIAEEIKPELKKAVSKKVTWEGFLKELECQY